MGVTMGKIVVLVKLVAHRQVNSGLVATLRACNAAASRVSDIAWACWIIRNYLLKKITYGEVRSVFGLGSHPAVRCIKKVVDAYHSGDSRVRRTTARTFP